MSQWQQMWWARGHAQDARLTFRELARITDNPDIAKWAKERELEAKELAQKVIEKLAELEATDDR